jgi:heme oxygenase
MTRAPLGTRRSLLRTSTAESHRDLETAIDKRDFFKSPDGYRDYILRLDLFYRCFCSSMSAGHVDLLSRWRLLDHRTWLAEDIAYLGLRPNVTQQDVSALLRLERQGCAYGASYVVLGSALGARLLTARAAALRFTNHAGGTYLSSQASSDQWRGFLADLEAHVDLPADDLLAGAEATFATYAACMTGPVAT